MTKDIRSSRQVTEASHVGPYPYHVPVLSKPDFGVLRAPGPGLGNLLFPIARAFAGHQALGGTFVFPTMRQLKFGPTLRCERDKRTYGEILRPRSASETADWARAMILRKTPEHFANPAAKAIEYAGMADQFHSLPNDCSAFRDFLIRNSRGPIVKKQYDIAIHFRKGDFQAPTERHARQSVQLPVFWYRSAYRNACDWLGQDQPSVILFTDGDPAATAAELGIDTIVFEPPGNALTSLIAMSQSRVLIPSRSTFSLWAQYLGKNTAFWPACFELRAFKRVDPAADILV